MGRVFCQTEYSSSLLVSCYRGREAGREGKNLEMWRITNYRNHCFHWNFDDYKRATGITCRHKQHGNTGLIITRINLFPDQQQQQKKKIPLFSRFLLFFPQFFYTKGGGGIFVWCQFLSPYILFFLFFPKGWVVEEKPWQCCPIWKWYKPYKSIVKSMKFCIPVPIIQVKSCAFYLREKLFRHPLENLVERRLVSSLWTLREFL